MTSSPYEIWRTTIFQINEIARNLGCPQINCHAEAVTAHRVNRDDLGVAGRDRCLPHKGSQCGRKGSQNLFIDSFTYDTVLLLQHLQETFIIPPEVRQGRGRQRYLIGLNSRVRGDRYLDPFHLEPLRGAQRFCRNVQHKITFWMRLAGEAVSLSDLLSSKCFPLFLGGFGYLPGDYLHLAFAAGALTPAQADQVNAGLVPKG